jgi:hypothetical protein
LDKLKKINKDKNFNNKFVDSIKKIIITRQAASDKNKREVSNKKGN